MKFEKIRIELNPTDTIEINIVAIVNKRENYQEQIANISDYVVKQFSELKVDHMNSPIKVRIKIK